MILLPLEMDMELRKYPLNENYEPAILDFINRLNQYDNILVKTNATSTHVVGDYDEVMPILQGEIKLSFEKYGKAIFVMKVLHGELAI